MHFLQVFPKIVHILLFFIFFSLRAQQRNSIPDFTPPLDIPLYLSANFGELRSTHFHSGIDFKTQQETGKPVFSVFDGHISRIKIRSGGYGKSLYITHSNGYVSVYAHLNDFIPQISAYVKENQYKMKRFEVDLYLSDDKFQINKGQLIAYSGNTGNSGGPHLHFEIRDSYQHPLNGLLFNFNITDNIKPTIRNLAIYPIDKNSYINGRNEKLIVKPVGKNGKYRLGSDSIEVVGTIGFGVETYDYLNGSSNRCTVYSIKLEIDDSVYYYHEMDKFSFNEVRYVYSHIDYEEKLNTGLKIHKLFLDPNNKLSIYKQLKNRGKVSFNTDTLHNVKITVKDSYQNSSVLSFKIRSSNSSYIFSPIEDTAFLRKFYYNTTNTYENSEVRIVIPENALFRDIDFNYSRVSGDSTYFSDIHFVHSELTPLYRPYTLSVKTKNLNANIRDKAILAIIDKENNLKAMGGEWNDGFITTSTPFFGKYVVVIDTVSPIIMPVNFKNNGFYKAGDTLTFTIEDDLSGIQSYNGYVDKQWALFEYDAKNNRLIYVVDKEHLVSGKKHELELYVSDERKNISIFRSGFTF